MDNETRGIIVKMLDDAVNNLSKKDNSIAITSWFNDEILVEDIALDWVSKDTKETTSDLAVGYIIGYLANAAHHIITDRKWREAVSKLYSNQGTKTLETNSAEKAKKLKTIFIKVTNDEVREIRGMLQSKIPLIRKEVYRALSV